MLGVMAIRLVVVDDHYLVREGLVRLVETVPDLEIVASGDSYGAAVEAIRDERPDVVVTDIRMPPTGSDEGIRLAAELRETNPEIGVVVLSQYAEPAYALACFEHGSEGRAYLLKDRISDVEQLVAAVRAVADGGSVIDPRVIDALVSARSARRESPLQFLTPRETEVLSEIATGKNNAATAKAIGLSERAVEKHINSIFSKLGLSEEPDVHRRVRAVLLFLGES